MTRAARTRFATFAKCAARSRLCWAKACGLWAETTFTHVGWLGNRCQLLLDMHFRDSCTKEVGNIHNQPGRRTFDSPVPLAPLSRLLTARLTRWYILFAALFSSSLRFRPCRDRTLVTLAKRCILYQESLSSYGGQPKRRVDAQILRSGHI